VNVREGLGIAMFVAGHDFASLRPGEHCQGSDCKGVSSLVDLTSLADVVQDGDSFVAHTGVLNKREIGEIKNARDEMRKVIEMAWGA
jgi:hypothetical protein